MPKPLGRIMAFRGERSLARANREAGRHAMDDDDACLEMSAEEALQDNPEKLADFCVSRDPALVREMEARLAHIRTRPERDEGMGY